MLKMCAEEVALSLSILYLRCAYRYDLHVAGSTQ